MRRQAATVGVILLLALIAVGFALYATRIETPTAKDPLTVSRFVTGTIVGVDSSGSAVCLRPDAGGEQLCSIPLQRPGSPSLFVGQHVGVAIASIATGTPGNFIQVFVVYSPPPKP